VFKGNATEMTEMYCILDPAQRRQRGDDIRALGRDGLCAAERTERHATLSFRRDPEVRARVERIVAAESACCPFLDFNLRDNQEATVLNIAAPEGGEWAVNELVELFAG
jgi:hypothetical protein